MAGSDFDFGAASVARAYDDVLVPLMFDPWARSLLAERADWQGRTVLDVATGTGIVARMLVDLVGPSGRVVATDLNPEMIQCARERCNGSVPAVEFLECPASPLPIPDQSIDTAVCQQGFQFFPDRAAAAQELARVLRPGGSVLVSTWLPVSECVFFEWICDALVETGEPEIAATMRLPFDHCSADDLRNAFGTAGFTDIVVSRRAVDFVMPGGVEQAITATHATPIGPSLRALADDKLEAFEAALERRVGEFSPDGITMGKLATNLLEATKPTRV